MKIYIITEERTQPTFINKYGDEAQPYSHILGARKTMEEAKRFKQRIVNMLQDEAFVGGEFASDASAEITVIDIPD